MVIKSCEDLVRLLLSCNSRDDFNAEALVMRVEEPIRVRNVTLSEGRDITWLVSASMLDWNMLRRKVRISGLDALVGYEDSMSRFKCSGVGTIFIDETREGISQYSSYTFTVHNGPVFVVALSKTDDALQVAWECVVTVLSRKLTKGTHALICCGEVWHLIDLARKEFDMKWELHMTLLERCAYLDSAKANGSEYVMSGKEFLEL